MINAPLLADILRAWSAAPHSTRDSNLRHVRVKLEVGGLTASTDG